MENRDRPCLRRLLQLIVELAEARAAKLKEARELPQLTDTVFSENLSTESQTGSTPSKETLLSMPTTSLRVH